MSHSPFPEILESETRARRGFRRPRSRGVSTSPLVWSGDWSIAVTSPCDWLLAVRPGFWPTTLAAWSPGTPA